MIIKIDLRSNAAKTFAEYVKTLSFVKVMDESITPYEKKILESYKKDKRSSIKTANIWDSIK
ncbi:MAG: hypothetical protein H3C31_11120 [Brumimicrobium sp.]|nr:hypothetical protein [Brumimicrobium sp.]